MKNLKIGKKLLLGFGIMLLLLLIAAAISFFNMNTMNTQITNYSVYTVPNNNHVWQMRRDMISVQRKCSRIWSAASACAKPVEQTCCSIKFHFLRNAALSGQSPLRSSANSAAPKQGRKQNPVETLRSSLFKGLQMCKAAPL